MTAEERPRQVARWRLAWRGLHPAAKAVVVVLTGILVLEVGVSIISRATGPSNPSGPTSSSLSTTGEGYEAWAELLQRYGHPVVRLRQPISSSDLPSGSTVVVADPTSLNNAEKAALASFLDGGGEVVTAGVLTDPLIQSLLGGQGPRWGPELVAQAFPASSTTSTTSTTGRAVTGGVRAVLASGQGGAWTTTGAAEPVLVGAAPGPAGPLYLAVAATVGAGRLIMISDSSVFSNSYLAAADNAQFALDVAGAPGRTVVFDENAHGYGTAFGFAGLPIRWQWGLVLFALSALLSIWSRAWRFGPPERAGRALPPPRRLYVDSLATSLARVADRRQATAPVVAAAREKLAERVGLDPQADDAQLLRRAEGSVVPEEITAAVLSGGQTDAQAIATGRALAWLERTRT